MKGITYINENNQTQLNTRYAFSIYASISFWSSMKRNHICYSISSVQGNLVSQYWNGNRVYFVCARYVYLLFSIRKPGFLWFMPKFSCKNKLVNVVNRFHCTLFQCYWCLFTNQLQVCRIGRPQLTVAPLKYWLLSILSKLTLPFSQIFYKTFSKKPRKI